MEPYSASPGVCPWLVGLISWEPGAAERSAEITPAKAARKRIAGISWNGGAILSGAYLNSSGKIAAWLKSVKVSLVGSTVPAVSTVAYFVVTVQVLATNLLLCHTPPPESPG